MEGAGLMANQWVEECLKGNTKCYVLVTGGTGSVGQAVVTRLIARGARVRVFSRDEAKQHEMRLSWNNHERLEFQVGDVRDYASVVQAVSGACAVVHCAALKHVPACEVAVHEAVRTNILGTQNLIRAICESDNRVDVVVGISTDKACNPASVMGMTKAIMERMLVEANLRKKDCRFVIVRFGNVVPSRGSVIPLFLEKIARGEGLTVTHPQMTRFFMALSDAADLVLLAMDGMIGPGETLVPKLKSAKIVDVAKTLLGKRDNAITFGSMRPGEKLDEELVTAEEGGRSRSVGDYIIISPLLTELVSPYLQNTFKYLPLANGYDTRIREVANRMDGKELRAFLKRALGKEFPR